MCLLALLAWALHKCAQAKANYGFMLAKPAWHPQNYPRVPLQFVILSRRSETFSHVTHKAINVTTVSPKELFVAESLSIPAFVTELWLVAVWLANVFHCLPHWYFPSFILRFKSECSWHAPISNIAHFLVKMLKSKVLFTNNPVWKKWRLVFTQPVMLNSHLSVLYLR